MNQKNGSAALRLLPLIFLFILAPSTRVDAQGHFVRHGFLVTMPSYSAGSDQQHLVFRIGYHVRGLAEIGVGFERFGDDRSELVATAWVPSVAVFPIRQSGAWPVTVRIGMGYEPRSLAGDPIVALEGLGLPFKSDAYRFEIGVSRRLGVDWTIVGRKSDVLLAVFAEYRDVSVTLDEQIENSRQTAWFAELLLDLDVGDLAFVTFGPRLGVIDDQLGAGFTFGVGAGER